MCGICMGEFGIYALLAVLPVLLRWISSQLSSKLGLDINLRLPKFIGAKGKQIDIISCFAGCLCGKPFRHRDPASGDEDSIDSDEDDDETWEECISDESSVYFAAEGKRGEEGDNIKVQNYM